MYRYLILILIGMLFTRPAPGQYSFDKAVLVSKESGVPVSNIRCITKGPDGFIWLGTSEGLCRFDGYQSKMYREGADFEYSLFDNTVSAVLPVGNAIWAGTSQGISVMDLHTQRFRHYQFDSGGKSSTLSRRFDQQVSVLYPGRKGGIWVGTSERGLAYYDPATDNFRFYPLPADYKPLLPALGSPQSILSIIADTKNDSLIWAGTAAGLLRVNTFTSEVQLFHFPQQSKDYQVAVNAFRRLFQDNDGLIYTGSWAAGVNVFDPATRQLTPLPVKNETGNRMVKSVTGGLHRKSENEIWISTITGLALYDTRAKDITWYKLNNAAQHEYYSIGYIDESGRIWQAGLNGLSYFDPLLQQFAVSSFRHLSKPDWAFAFYIIPDATGKRVTVCPRITDGLFVLDRSRNEWSKIIFPNGQSFLGERESVKGFLELQPGEFLISSDKGIYRFNLSSNKMAPVAAGTPFLPTRRGDVLKDRKGNVWLSDDTRGLTKWDPRSGQITYFREQFQEANPPEQAYRLTTLFEDSRGNIWFQRLGGMGVYHAGRDSILSFMYSRNALNSFHTVNAFAEDSKGRVWVNSTDGWVGYAESARPEKGVVHKFNTRERGINGNFLRLATDLQGNIWAYTLKEMIRISPEDLSFTTYSFQYGPGVADFYHFSFLPSGEVIFGGRNEITIVNPSRLKRNSEIPVPYISGLQVLNEPDAIIPFDLPLRLRHQQNFFSISFSAKAYTLPAEVKFRYRLKGFEEWSEPSSRRFANYTNVPGGRYVFQLQAANNEGTWNKELLELPVWVGTAFWKTTWFRAGLLLLLAGGLWALYRYRMNQIRKKEQLKSAYEKKIANVEMSSLLSQMNPHFIFNSLNSIDSYILKNETQKASEYLNNFARLMRLILQHSRSNYITMADELEALELYMQMEQMRFKHQFSYRVEVGENIDPSALLIPPMLIQPFVENAIWHGLMHKTGGEPGRVDIRFALTDQLLQCTVEDNGIGREKAAALRANKTGNRKKSMGIQITLDRIEMINKLYGSHTSVEITDLHDPEGNPAGTRVLLRIPV